MAGGCWIPTDVQFGTEQALHENEMDGPHKLAMRPDQMR